jgi:2-methylcitrate dehydratase PrpD
MHDTSPRDFTKTLLRICTRVPQADQAPDAWRLARQCVLDWVAVTLAARHEPLVDALAASLVEEGATPQAIVLGRSLRLSCMQAALLNGTASHALDYDDVNYALMGHPTVPVLPALLALAEYRRLEGEVLLAAFMAGYEFECRVGLAVGPSHYARGFHATATVGALGAAVACAHLLGLDADAMAHAVGIAATQTAGLKSMFGTDCKPLHAGNAARTGLLSALLAARGFTSRTDSLECEQGFAATHADRLDAEAALAQPPLGLHLRANLFKYHASCYETHATIEATARLRREHDLNPAAIDWVEIRVNPYCDRICNIAEPATGLQAKFSLRQTAAFALTGVDTADVASFSDALVGSAESSATRAKCRVVLDPLVPASQSVVRLRDCHGQLLEAHHDASRPMVDLDHQQTRLEAKAHSLLDGLHGSARCDEIVRAVNGMGAPGGLVRLLGSLARCV